ncbi:hypothetical protein SK128_008495 [Halocaridina rubra]|uniref:Chromo domain-containing protein n=1 Tax=Halocaridina rubra TaxID=373956 RepID=A0AAN8X7M7_HALRR
MRMNSSFSVDDEEENNSFGDNDEGDAARTGDHVLVLPEEEDINTSAKDASSRLLVENIPLYVTQGENGKPMIISGPEEVVQSDNLDNIVRIRSDKSSDANPVVNFEGYSESNYDSPDDTDFDGFSEEESAESEIDKRRILNIRKLQKMNASCEEARESYNDNGLNGSDEKSSPCKDRKRKAKSSIPVEIGSKEIATNVSKRRRISVKPISSEKVAQPLAQSTPPKRKAFDLEYDMSSVRKSLNISINANSGDNVKVNEVERERREPLGRKAYDFEEDTEFIGIHCSQVGCTVTWLESMTTKMVTVNNGIVFELNEFSKKINWEREHVAKWILRLRGILDLEPSHADVEKIHVILKRRKALAVTLAGSKKGLVRLFEFDNTKFTLPSETGNETTRHNILNDSVYTQNSEDFKSAADMTDSRVSYYSYNQNRCPYFTETNSSIGPLCDAAGLSVSDLNVMLEMDVHLTEGMIVELSFNLVNEKASHGEVMSTEFQFLSMQSDDPRVSFYFIGNNRYPIFKELDVNLGYYCSEAGITVADLNSKGVKDIRLTQGAVIEIFDFFREHSASLKALATTLMTFRRGSPLNLNSVVTAILALVKKRENSEDFLKAYFKYPNSKPFSKGRGRSRNLMKNVNLVTTNGEIMSSEIVEDELGKRSQKHVNQIKNDDKVKKQHFWAKRRKNAPGKNRKVGNNFLITTDDESQLAKNKIKTPKEELINGSESPAVHSPSDDHKLSLLKKLNAKDKRVKFVLKKDGRIVPQFTETNYYLGSYCSAIDLTVADLNSSKPKDVVFSNGAILELYQFYQDRGCSNVMLADRIFELRNIRRVTSQHLAARIPKQLLKLEKVNLSKIFRFRTARIPVDSRSKPKILLPKMKLTPFKKKSVQSKKISRHSLKKPPYTGKKSAFKSNIFVDKEVEKAKGKERSITRADIVLLYGEWLKKKSITGSNVCVADLLCDVMKLVEDRNVSNVRIPAGTLMSSSVKLYEEYRRMWKSNRRDALRYLEEDWIEDIHSIVSNTRMTRSLRGEDTSLLETAGTSSQQQWSLESTLKKCDLKSNAIDIPKTVKPRRVSKELETFHSSSGSSKDNDRQNVNFENESAMHNAVMDMNWTVKKIGPKSKLRKSSMGVLYSDLDTMERDELKLESSVSFGSAMEILNQSSFEGDEETSSSIDCLSHSQVLHNDLGVIDKILDYRCVLKDSMLKEVEYLVRWIGCGPEEDTWIKAENLECPENIIGPWQESILPHRNIIDKVRYKSLEHKECLRKMDILETWNDVSDDIKNPISMGTDIDFSNKENSPDRMSVETTGYFEPKINKKFVTIGELLHLYDSWRRETIFPKESKEGIFTSNINSLISKVDKLFSSCGIINKYSDCLLQACFILTLRRKMLASREAVWTYLENNCLPTLEKTLAQQSEYKLKTWKMKGCDIYGKFSETLQDIQKLYVDSAESRSTHRSRVTLLEEEIACLERSLNCAQGNSHFFTDSLKRQIILLNEKVANSAMMVQGKRNLKNSVSGRNSIKNTEYHTKTCYEIQKLGVVEKNAGDVVDSVLEYLESNDGIIH